MIHAFCRADTGQLAMFPQEGWQAELLEMVLEQHLRRVARGPALDIRLM